MLKEDDQHVGCLLREYGEDVPGIIQDIPRPPPHTPEGENPAKPSIPDNTIFKGTITIRYKYSSSK
jgi:hypothetical protein